MTLFQRLQSKILSDYEKNKKNIESHNDDIALQKNKIILNTDEVRSRISVVRKNFKFSQYK